MSTNVACAKVWLGKINTSFRMVVTSQGEKGRGILLGRAPQWASTVCDVIFLKQGGGYMDVYSSISIPLCRSELFPNAE